MANWGIAFSGGVHRGPWSAGPVQILVAATILIAAVVRWLGFGHPLSLTASGGCDTDGPDGNAVEVGPLPSSQERRSSVPRVVIVDDEALIRSGFELILSNADY